MVYREIAHPTEPGRARADMIRRDSDGAVIPADPLNTDWQAYEGWLAAGNAPAAAEPAAPSRRRATADRHREPDNRFTNS